MKAMFLNRIIGWLVGGSVYKAITDIVLTLAKEDMSGEEKKAAAKRRVRALGTETEGFLVNLAIEAAVASMREKQK